MYTFDSRVRYSEVDREGRLALGSIINYMQDASTFQSEDIGLGLGYLKERSRVWLLNAWQIQIKHRPLLGESIRVGTWAYGFKSMYGYRNFVIDDKEGSHLILANSVWVFYDLERGRPVKVSEDELRGYGSEPKLSMDYCDRKITVPLEGTEADDFPVRRYQIDTNGHVNNGQYICMAREYVPEDFRTFQIRAEYKRQAVLGDRILPVVSGAEGGYVVSLRGLDGKPYAVVEFKEEDIV